MCLLPYLAADASGDVPHLDPVELSNVQVFTIKRLYLDFYTWKVVGEVMVRDGCLLPRQQGSGRGWGMCECVCVTHRDRYRCEKVVEMNSGLRWPRLRHLLALPGCAHLSVLALHVAKS